MFDSVTEIDEAIEAEPKAVPAASRRSAIALPVERDAGSRYGARPVNMPAAITVALIHVALFGALFQMRSVYVQKKAASLAVVNLTPPAPPPPAEAEPVPPTRPEVVAPRPIVQTPVPVVYQVPVIDKITPLPVVQAPPAPPTPVAIPSTIDAGDLGTRMVSGKPPRYPIESRRRHEQGTVVLALTLGIDGRVASVIISQSSGSSRLDDAARDAVRTWRWEPTIRGGQPVQVRGIVEIPFVLKG